MKNEVVNKVLLVLVLVLFVSKLLTLPLLRLLFFQLLLRSVFRVLSLASNIISTYMDTIMAVKSRSKISEGRN